MGIISEALARVISNPGPFAEVEAFIDSLPLPIEGEYRPTWDDRHEPDPIEAAWWSGFTLGREGEYAGPPACLPDRERYHFTCGRLGGWQESDDGQEWIADMEALRDLPPAREPHPCEAVEAIGAVEARKG